MSKGRKVHPDLELITYQEKNIKRSRHKCIKITLSKRQCPVSPRWTEVFLFRKDCGARKSALLIIPHLFYCLESIGEMELEILEQGSFSLTPGGRVIVFLGRKRTFNRINLGVCMIFMPLCFHSYYNGDEKQTEYLQNRLGWDCSLTYAF